MEKRNDGDAAAEVVEAAGFLVRDARGRKRVFLGDLIGGDSEYHPGVAIYDEDGSERVALLLGDAGPVLSYAVAGDTRLEVGVIDRGGEGTEPGPFVTAMDRDGRVAWSVRVGDDGVVCGPCA